MKSRALLALGGLLVILALWYFLTASGSEILSTIVDPIVGGLSRGVRMVTEAKDRALPVAQAIAAYIPTGTGGLEGVMLAGAEWETRGSFDPGAVNDQTGCAGVWQMAPKYYPGIDLTDIDASTAAIASSSINHWSRVTKYTTDYRLAASLWYASHLEGGKILDVGLHSGVTWASFNDRVKAELGGLKGRKADGWWNSRTGCWTAGGNAAAWQEWYDGLTAAPAADEA